MGSLPRMESSAKKVLRYSADPPRFQALHCLRNRVEGGASYFVDSFASARRLARTHPHHVALLTKTKLRYEYDNDDHYLSWQHLVLPPNLSTPYAVVNWSPPFQAMRRAMHRRVTTGEEAEAVVEVDARCFDALQAWEAELRRPEHAYEFTMREGDLVLFDNRRILHARRGFRDLSEEKAKERGVEIVPGEPTRWLKGCYLNGEVVWDKLVVLNNRVRGGLPMPEASWEEVDEEQEVD